MLLSQIAETLTTINHFSKSLMENLETISKISREVTDTSNEVAGSMEAQAHSITQINQAMIESNDEIIQVSKAATDMAQLSQKTFDITERGSEQIASLRDEIEVASKNLDETACVLETLKQQSEEINSLLHSIQKIAEQTNLLALNAAIGEVAASISENDKKVEEIVDSFKELEALMAKLSDPIDSDKH